MAKTPSKTPSKTPTKTPVKECLKWMECCRCSILYCNVDEAAHGINCTPDLQDLRRCDSKYSFIVNRCLTAPAFVIKDGKSFPENWKCSYVYLNPETIVALRLSNRDLRTPVLINQSLAFRLWPDSTVPLKSIGIHADGLQRLLDGDVQGETEAEKYLTLVDMEQDVAAEEIHFEVVNDSKSYGHEEFRGQKFKETFLYYNEDRLFSLGEIVKFQYLGTFRSLKVQKAKVAGQSLALNDYMKPSDLAFHFSQMQLLSDEDDKNGRHTVSTFFSLKSDTQIFFWNESRKLRLFGGYDSMRKQLLTRLKHALCLQLDNSEVPAIRSLLLYGPPGVGKTALVHFLADSLEVPVFHVLPEHAKKRELLVLLKNDILNENSCIVFIDNIDAVCPKKDVDAAYSVRQLIRCLVQEKRDVFVIGATNRREEIHEAVLQSNYISIAQKMKMPNTEDRIDILTCILRSVKHSLTAEEIEELAKWTQYFSGYDLNNLCKEAMMGQRFRCEGKQSSECFSTSLTMDEVVKCLPKIEPHMMKSLQLSLPFVKVIKSKVTWNDIGGLRDVKEIIDQMIGLRIHHPEVFDRLNIQPLRGLLMFGPPGCSKTMVANAVANECGVNFLAVEGTSVFSKFVGSTEANISKLFSTAREIAPCVIFFDEFETLAQNRNQEKTPSGNYQNRALQQMLVELDRIGANGDLVCVLAATNRPELLDQASFRPGRFDRVVYIPLPDDNGRNEILRVCLEQQSVLLDDISVEQIVLRTCGYSSAEICQLVREAVETATADSDGFISRNELQMKHFEHAFQKIRPRTKLEQIAILEKFAKQSIH